MKKNKCLFIAVFFVLFLGSYFVFLSANAGNTVTTKATVLTSEKAFKLFYDALGNRRNLLNANYKSGYSGAYDYITTEIGTTTIANATSTFSNPRTGVREKLDWFKTKFLENTNSNLNAKDKDGIKQAMIARYNDICFAGIKNNISAFLKWLPTILKPLQATKKTAIKACETAFKNAIATSTRETKDYFIEVAKIDKELCLNTAYLDYNNAIKNAIATSATSTIVSASFTACKNDSRVINWW
ncbi:MAG: hypothetical protein V1649_01600 [Patescibacteria group bacterium]